jgi:hypothetical protein
VHALAALFALLLFLILLLVRSKGSLLCFLRGLPAAALLVLLIAVWWHTEPGGIHSLSFLSRYYSGPFIGTIPKRIHLLFLDNYHLFEGNRGAVAATILSLAIIVPSLAALRRAVARGEWRAIRSSAPFVLFLCAICCFLLLPGEIPRQSILYQRFSTLVLISLALLGAVASGPSNAGGRTAKAGRVAPAIFVAAALLHFALWADHFIDFNSENASFGPALFPAGAKGTLAGLVIDHTYRGRPYYIHFPSYYTVWRRGVATTKLIDYRFSNVRRKRGGRWFPSYMEWPGSLEGYDGRYRRADLLLVRGEPQGAAAQAVKGRVLFQEGGTWKLYGRKTGW